MKNQEKEQLEKSQKTEGKTEKVKKETSKKLTKATENQINLQFESSFSNLIKDEQKGIDEQKDINKILGDQQVKARVYFIRHGESVEDDGKGGLQSSGAKLKTNAKKDFKKIGRFLKRKGLNASNTYVMYHDGGEDKMVRIIESAEIINKELKIGKERQSRRVLGWHTTNKEIDNQTERSLEVAAYTSFETSELIRELKTKENINIVCVIHKSNIGAIRQTLFKEENKGIDIGHGGYANGEIQEIDVKKDGQAVNYTKERFILLINSHNFDAKDNLPANSNNYNGNLLAILEGEEELREYIGICRTRKLQIWELQNLVNAYFQKNPKLFEKYLLSDSHELRVFCIANLVKNKEFDLVKENFYNLLNKEREISLIKLVDALFVILDEGQIEQFLEYLENNINVGGWLDSKLKERNLDYYMNYIYYTKPHINDIRNKTLDERLTAGEAIIPLGFQGDKYKTIDELINGTGITLIEGEAGAGKSTKLLEIMERLKPSDAENNNIFPIYINLGEVKYANISGRIREQKRNMVGEGKYKFVYLFDALDEARYDADTKKKFFEKLSTLGEAGGKVIVTSRPNIIQEEDKLDEKNRNLKNIEKIKLKPLDEEQIEKYINTYLSEKQKQIWEEWKEEEFIKEIENNPLILSIICNLLVSGDNIEGVDSISKLYEKIVNGRLVDWEEWKTSEVILDELEDRTSLLGEIAYKSFLHKEEITEDFIVQLIKTKYSKSIPKTRVKGKIKYNLECLNMIFRQKEGEYIFVHESFREYFLYMIYNDNKIDYLKRLDEDLVDDRKSTYITIIPLVIFEKGGLEILKEIVRLEGFKNNENAIAFSCLAIGKIGEIGGLELLKEIVKLEGFKDNEEAIKFSCASIFAIGEVGGLEILKEIVKLEGFKNNEDAIDVSCGAIGEIGEVEGLEILKEIVKLEGFKDNEEAIKFSCGVIGKLGEVGGLEILKEIVKLEGFKNNEEAIKLSPEAIWRIGEVGGLEILKEIVKLEGFKDNKVPIRNACGAIWKIGEMEGLEILKEIVKLEGFKNNEEVISIGCEAIWKIGEVGGLEILKEIVKLEGFKNNEKAINNSCGAIGVIGEMEGLAILKDIVKLEGFKNNEKAISLSCGAIGGIRDIGGLEILKDIVRMELFKNNERAIVVSCLVIRDMGGLEILKEIVKLEGFKNNVDAIEFSCVAIRELQETGGLEILKEIVKLEGFKNNEKAMINSFFLIVLSGEAEGLEILKEIVKLEGFQNNEKAIINSFVILVETLYKKNKKRDRETSFLIEIKDGIKRFENSDDKEIRRIGVLLLEKIG